MKKKTKHYPSVHVATDVFEAVQNNFPNVKVKIGTFYYNEPICEFFVPTTSVVKHGNAVWVPHEIVKSRAKHDFNITWDHSSGGSI